MTSRLVIALLLAGRLAAADPDEKSPYVALGLSAGTTIGGLALIEYDHWRHESNPNRALVATGVVAIVVGPTTGHIYAGRTWNEGLAFRLMAVGGGVLSLPFLASCLADDNQRASCYAGGTIFVASAVLYGGASLYEIGMAGAAASRYNHERATRANIAVVPLRARDGSTVPALAIGGRF